MKKQSSETDAIRHHANEIIGEANKIDQREPEKDTGKAKAIKILEEETLPALRAATRSTNEAIGALKGSSPPEEPRLALGDPSGGDDSVLVQNWLLALAAGDGRGLIPGGKTWLLPNRTEIHLQGASLDIRFEAGAVFNGQITPSRDAATRAPWHLETNLKLHGPKNGLTVENMQVFLTSTPNQNADRSTNFDFWQGTTPGWTSDIDSVEIDGVVFEKVWSPVFMSTSLHFSNPDTSLARNPKLNNFIFKNCTVRECIMGPQISVGRLGTYNGARPTVFPIQIIDNVIEKIDGTPAGLTASGRCVQESACAIWLGQQYVAFQGEAGGVLISGNTIDGVTDFRNAQGNSNGESTEIQAINLQGLSGIVVSGNTLRNVHASAYTGGSANANNVDTIYSKSEYLFVENNEIINGAGEGEGATTHKSGTSLSGRDPAWDYGDPAFNSWGVNSPSGRNTSLTGNNYRYDPAQWDATFMQRAIPAGTAIPRGIRAPTQIDSGGEVSGNTFYYPSNWNLDDPNYQSSSSLIYSVPGATPNINSNTHIIV